ncbi:MAG: type III polyketide synthase [Planctomyces sp.]|nr:type III polyketide synthase [Planctomyces sp.]
MSHFEIIGLGTALPDHSIEQADAATFAGTCLSGEADSDRAETLVKALYRRSGVRSRNSVVLDSSTHRDAISQSFYSPSDDPSNRGPGTAARMQKFEREAPALATKACLRALQAAEVSPQQITHLITVSCSGFSAPGFDLSLFDSLGLRPTVSRTHVGFMGCHGALNAIRVARAFATAEPDSVILICALELCSLHHQYGWDPQRIVANSLFADGAAALVGCSQSLLTTGRNHPRLLVQANASSVLPETADMMTWRIGDHGFQMTLSPEVPQIITNMLPTTIDAFLSQHQLSRHDVRSWVIHPGGPRILSACTESLGLSEDQIEPSSTILGRCGNMSSPTVLFILEELQHRNAEFPCVMLGFGPGLNVEMAILLQK